MKVSRSHRVWLIALTGAVLQSCGLGVNRADHSFIESPPASLTAASSENALSNNALSTNGCAFAGTWRYRFRQSRLRIDGWIIFEVLPESTGPATGGSSIRAAIDWDLGELGNFESFIETASFYVFDEGREPTRSLSTYAYVLYDDGALRKMPVRFELADDGLTLDFQIYPTNGSRWLESRAEKIRAGKCGQAVQFIDAIKAGLENKSGNQLPPSSAER
jgi:hypothetical protein